MSRRPGSWSFPRLVSLNTLRLRHACPSTRPIGFLPALQPYFVEHVDDMIPPTHGPVRTMAFHKPMCIVWIRMHSSELLHTRLSTIPRHNCPAYLDTSVHCHRLLSESETYVVLSHRQQSPAHCEHFLAETSEITVNQYQTRTNTFTETNSRQCWKETCGDNSPCVACREMSDCSRHRTDYILTPLSPQTNMTLTPCTASFTSICNTLPRHLE